MIFMVFINAMMMGSFLEGLEESGSVAAVALSTASNFSVSALYGVLFFKEQVNMMWCVGFIMILIGAFHWCFCGNGVKNYNVSNLHFDILIGVWSVSSVKVKVE